MAMSPEQNLHKMHIYVFYYGGYMRKTDADTPIDIDGYWTTFGKAYEQGFCTRFNPDQQIEAEKYSSFRKQLRDYDQRYNKAARRYED